MYSIDDNLWGRAIECGEMEDPWAVPPPGVWSLTKPTATEPRDVVIGFEQGVPVAVDGERWACSSSSTELNDVVGSYGWGRIDMVENRRVGIKSRETYECPASLALILAHADLESISSSATSHREKARLEPRYAELDLRRPVVLAAASRRSTRSSTRASEFVTGEVRLRLEPGSLRGRPAGAARTASTTTGWPPTTPPTASATRTRAGFVRLWGLGIETWAARQGAERPAT